MTLPPTLLRAQVMHQLDYVFLSAARDLEAKGRLPTLVPAASTAQPSAVTTAAMAATAARAATSAGPRKWITAAALSTASRTGAAAGVQYYESKPAVAVQGATSGTVPREVPSVVSASGAGTQGKAAYIWRGGDVVPMASIQRHRRRLQSVPSASLPQQRQLQQQGQGVEAESPWAARVAARRRAIESLRRRHDEKMMEVLAAAAAIPLAQVHAQEQQADARQGAGPSAAAGGVAPPPSAALMAALAELREAVRAPQPYRQGGRQHRTLLAQRPGGMEGDGAATDQDRDQDLDTLEDEDDLELAAEIEMEEEGVGRLILDAGPAGEHRGDAEDGLAEQEGAVSEAAGRGAHLRGLLATHEDAIRRQQFRGSIARRAGVDLNQPTCGLPGSPGAWWVQVIV